MSIPNRSLNIVLAGIIFSLIVGCVSQREVEYMQRTDRAPKSFIEAEVPDYRLKPNDELYIRVNSLDDPTSNIFSTATGQQTSNTDNNSPFSASLVSYTINKEGFLQMPIVGNIFVKDKTLSEVSKILTDSLSHILSQPVVKVKLVNRYVSVLGFVRNPGHFPYSQEKLSIYDAIGLAGDLTIFANRQAVTLTRNENGKNIVMNLDLTDPQLLASSYYYIRPNDMIYVRPLKKRIWGISEFPFGVLLSSLSFSLLVYSIIKK
ncbi:MAG: polysaccharide biosynthesis/export family protein [Candidatus Saccharimonadaceae bacterium]